MFQTACAYLRQRDFRFYALAAILAALALASASVLQILHFQEPGSDYHAYWAGVKALAHVERLYDFSYVSSLQGWPFGPGYPRPYINPPSALFLLIPTALLPYWVGYGVWVAGTYALMAWAGRRMGAPWWMILFPVVWLVVIAGQVTFLVCGLVGMALTLPRRPIVAGVLLGVAAAVKPQLLLFVPLGLLATRQWRTIGAAGLTGLALCLASAAIWGVSTWEAWFAALPRFQAQVVLANPLLLDDEITPFAMLATRGVDGAWAFLLAPFAAGLVWMTFRRTDSAADRLVAVFAAALTVTPYAMNYEACLFVPAVAIYLARTSDRLWLLYATVACLFAVGLIYDAAPIATAVILPLSSLFRDRSVRGRYPGLKPAA